MKIESKDEFKKNDIKNCMCYYFDDKIRFCDRDIAFSDILLDEKLCKVKKVVLQKVLTIYLQKSKMIHIIIYLLKKY